MMTVMVIDDDCNCDLITETRMITGTVAVVVTDDCNGEKKMTVMAGMKT